MNPIPVPDQAKAGRPYCQLVSMGPPRGVGDDECGTVEMLIEPHGLGAPGIGRAQYAYFRPTREELAQLNAGGFIEFAQCGNVVQPFSAVIWPPPAEPASGEPA